MNSHRFRVFQRRLGLIAVSIGVLVFVPTLWGDDVLLNSVKRHQSAQFLFNLGSLREGDVCVVVTGGFGGRYDEFVFSGKKLRVSVLTSKQKGLRISAERTILGSPQYKAREKELAGLFAAIKRVEGAKLAQEKSLVNADDSFIILVGRQTKDGLSYRARDFLETNSLEREFVELLKEFEKVRLLHIQGVLGEIGRTKP